MTASRTRARSATTTARILLMVAVVVGLTAMHVLAMSAGSGHGTPGGHLAMTAVPAHVEGHGAPSASTAPGAGDAGDGGARGDGHGGVGACTLFVATGLVVLSALVALTRGVPRGWSEALGADCRRAICCTDRSPPRVRPPRIALCVIRV